ncbi:hypothetical protein LG293_16335 (plasmid) [Citricoccus nitrophenolicus]
MPEAVALVPQDTVNQIILAAVNAAGPKDPTNPELWDSAVMKNAKALAVKLSDRSPEAQAIQMLNGASKFVATILAVKKEQSSQRGLVLLKTKVSENYPLGVEPIRTERTDSDSGATNEFCKELRALTGHRVLIWMEHQSRGNKKFRIIQYVQDLGPDSEYDDEAGNALVQQYLAA